MTLSGLALAYARRRPLATALVVALAAIGIGIATLTLLVSHELEGRMTRDARGIDLVVGAKGSPLQLVLAGVYHADVPPGNVPYASLARLRANPKVASAIPLALGDSVRGFRIVGTEPALVEHYGASLAEGAMFDAPMQAVIGSEAARATGLRVGASFAGTHGLAEGGGEHEAEPYRVVGVLAPTGSVVDRLVLTPVESVWDVHETHRAPPRPTPGVALANGNGRGKGGDGSPTPPAGAGGQPGGHAADADADRELTMILVRYASPIAAASLPREINQSSALVAASPAYETARLFTVFGVGLDLVRAFAAILVGASVLLLFVALAQALEERRYDLAILRALGARRRDLVRVLVVESVALAAAGAVIGLALGHAAAATIGWWLPAAAPLAGAAARPVAAEGVVVGLALAGGILAACWPAWRASRLDVAATLADA
ncbi:MAG: FtsX-like permease family protein [Burkholderiales bacterium]